MIGVATSVVTNVRTTMLSSRPVSRSSDPRARLSGKKVSQMTTACFHLGGAGAAGRRSCTSTSAGVSNHPSIPVRRSTRDSPTRPCAEPSHQARCGEDSHAASAAWSANR